MARRVFVLINTVPDKSEKVQMALKAFDEFASVERVTPPYDIIAVMETGDMTRMGLVVSKVAGMPGVERWLVCAGHGLSPTADIAKSCSNDGADATST